MGKFLGKTSKTSKNRKTSKNDGGVVRITGARSSLTEDVRRRQRRYMVSMAIRTLCVILAIVLWKESRIVAIIALVGGVLLPYLSVVYANAGRESVPDMPDTFVGYQPPPMLDPGPGIPTQGAPASPSQPS
jgi:Flp pilus assembly protein TadB